MKKDFTIAFLFYFFISVFFLRGILTSPGVLIGNDWGFPATSTQMHQVFRGALWTWTNEGSLLGDQIFTLNDTLIRLFLGFFSLFQVGGEWLTKGLALFLLTAGGLAMYYFCRCLKCSHTASLLAGLFYLTTPPVFNYLSMGWVFVLFSFVLLPFGVITFEKTVRQRSFGHGLVTAFIWSLALFQLQALSWFAIAFVLSSIFLVTSRKTLRNYLRSLVFVFLLTFLFNSYWIVSPLFERAFQAPVSSYDFGRFGIRLNPFDMLRLWGSLFNLQFETALPDNLVVFSFLLPIFAYLALILKRKNRYVLFFAVLSFVPLGIFLLRKVLLFIPYSSIFRDYSRNFVLSTFTYSALFAFTLDVFYSWLKNAKFLSKFKNSIVCFMFVGLLIGMNILTSYPFWSSDLSKEAEVESDVRLKTIQFSPEYQRVEEWLNKKEEELKALWLPTGASIAFLDKPKTAGPYGGTWDIFASFARKPGRIAITDRDVGYKRDFAEKIQRNICADESPYLADILGLTNIKHLVVRLNAYSLNKLHMEKIAHKLENDAKFRKVLLDDSVMVFENKMFLPHFYIPQNIIYSNDNIGSLVDVMEFGDYQTRPGIFLKNIGGLTDSKIEELSERADEIFVKGELKDAIGEEELAVVPVSKGDLPYVKWRPDYFIYPLVLKKEEYDKWRVRDEPKELFEKHLFYASKRISEMVKYAPMLTETEYSVNTRERYEKEVGEALEILKDLRMWRDKDFPKLWAEFKGAIWGHQEKIEEIGELENWGVVFEELEKKIDGLKIERDFSRLVYNLEVPEEGKYELFIKDNDEWINLGERYFEKGAQMLTLPIEGISENLVDENLKIKDYVPDSIYRISFDYQAPHGGSFFIAEGKAGETAETNLLPTGEEFRHFEMFFKSSPEAENASVHLSISIAQEKNLRVERIYQPELFLRYEIGDRRHEIPKITFVKVNPTKYKVKVEGAKEPYTLIFSESFHEGWKTYIQTSDTKPQTYGNIIASYFDLEIKEGTHKNIFLDRNTFETWGKKPISEERHLLVNGYANSWYITPEDAGGRETYEVIVEFQPQRLFYIGLFISGLTLIGCFGYLIFELFNRKF